LLGFAPLGNTWLWIIEEKTRDNESHEKKMGKWENHGNSRYLATWLDDFVGIHLGRQHGASEDEGKRCWDRWIQSIHPNPICSNLIGANLHNAF
jgi:hypothetical protein